ncbi:hypothetical protein PT077_09005, partial [Erysipelothrix rhusiopathiae]|nr:hypothetical protein [Erysipelothrix rhusiopathiae]
MLGQIQTKRIPNPIANTDEIMGIKRLLTSKSHQLIRETDIELRSYGWNRYVHHDINACYHTGFTGP